jgi:hypothetical protein
VPSTSASAAGRAAPSGIRDRQRCRTGQELPFGLISKAEPRLSGVAVIDDRQRTFSWRRSRMTHRCRLHWTPPAPLRARSQGTGNQRWRCRPGRPPQEERYPRWIAIAFANQIFASTKPPRELSIDLVADERRGRVTEPGAYVRAAGLRIDHLLLSPSVASRLVAAGVDRDVRAREGSNLLSRET